MKRFLFGAAGAWGHCAPASPFRPLGDRLKSFVRPECGLTPRPALNLTVRYRLRNAESLMAGPTLEVP